MQPITTCLWFDDKAEEAARFYTSIIPNSKMGKITHYTEGTPRPIGMVMTVTFTLNGQEIMALNGGPEFTFSPAFSFVLKCDSQRELDTYWEKLSVDKSAEQCGWLKDRYGMSWQVVPAMLDKLMADPDRAKVTRVTAAIMKMKKIDIAQLEKAYAG